MLQIQRSEHLSCTPSSAQLQILFTTGIFLFGCGSLPSIFNEFRWITAVVVLLDLIRKWRNGHGGQNRKAHLLPRPDLLDGLSLTKHGVIIFHKTQHRNKKKLHTTAHKWNSTCIYYRDIFRWFLKCDPPPTAIVVALSQTKEFNTHNLCMYREPLPNYFIFLGTPVRD